MLLFTSDLETRHGQEMLNQQQVAASIALETQIIGKIQGIQLTGKVYRLSGKEYDIALKNYLLRFPYAGFKDLILWGIVPDFIKMTHNQLGFGKKLIWTRE